MALYLVQHGLALTKEEDPGRGLAPEGREKVKLIAGVAKHYGVRVNCIEHSGKKRAEETAHLIAEALSFTGLAAARKGIGPKDSVEAMAATLDSDANLMLVSHLPFLERLVSLLTTGVAGFQIFKFQNGGIVCLDRDIGERLWHIKWTLMPTIN